MCLRTTAILVHWSYAISIHPAFVCLDAEHLTLRKWDAEYNVSRNRPVLSVSLGTSCFLNNHQTSHECSVMFAMHITYVISFSVLYVFFLPLLYISSPLPSLSPFLTVFNVIWKIILSYFHRCVCYACVHKQSCTPSQTYICWLVTINTFLLPLECKWRVVGVTLQ